MIHNRAMSRSKGNQYSTFLLKSEDYASFTHFIMSESNPQDLLDEIAKLSQDLNAPLEALTAPQAMIGGGYTPPNAPPVMIENVRAGEGVSQPNVSAIMEQLGYMCLDGSIPAEGKVREIVTKFDSGPRIIDGPTSHIKGDEQVCYEVLESGIHERVSGSPERYRTYH